MQSLEELSYDFQSYLGGSDIYGISTGIVLLILLGVVLIGLISRRNHLFNGLEKRATNLFLRMNFSYMTAPPTGAPLFRADGAAAAVGFLRSLDEYSATFVSPVRLAKGTLVRLDIASLPNFPHQEIYLDATVTHAKVINGGEAHFLIAVRFAVVPQAAHEPLQTYLKLLAA